MSAVASNVVTSLRSIRASINEIVQQNKCKQVVELLAVSKTKPNTMVMEAYNDGQVHFGENYVNELFDKAPLCPSDIKWHFIGHLQSNKAAKLVSIPNLFMVESVDSLKLAQKLEAACIKYNRSSLRITIQVNTSGEESKSGCEPSDCVKLLEEITENCPRLEVCGLMTIGRYETTPSRIYFDVLNQCKSNIFEKYPKYDSKDWVMSMGMSHDMALAIECGSTQVRVGTAIFGPREYIKTNDEN